jgi:propanol-preferring alcohol dehydrogenase
LSEPETTTVNQEPEVSEMRALRLIGWKQDAELSEVPAPEPGPGEALVRIGGAGACHSDLHLMRDFEAGALPWKLPFTLGHENAGWVEATGPGVDGLEIGRPVAVYGPWGCGTCARCLEGMENYCDRPLPGAGGGLGFDGGMAELMLVPTARYLVPLDNLTPVQAAPLTDAGLTPYHAIKRSLPLLSPGSFAVVIGAGGLGHMATQILGACTPTTIVVVDRNADALAMARNIGAHHVVAAGDDASAEIEELTKGRGADVVLDLVGSDDTLALASTVTRVLGHLTLVGIAGGTLPFTFFSPRYEVSVATTYWGTLPELLEVLDLAERGLIHAEVLQWSLEDAMHAYDAMAAGKLHGRAVVVP